MNETAISQEEKPDAKAIILAWWNDLQQRRGERAQLRRAHTLNDIIFTQAYQRLWQRLQGSDWRRADRLAIVAGVLAHVEIHDAARSFAAQLAIPRDGSNPRYSGLRFRRLLQREANDLLEPMIRAVKLIGKKANVNYLAVSLYWWNDKTRRQWAFGYYAQNPQAD
jgi:CRISPR system Cascade subunit CasB